MKFKDMDEKQQDAFKNIMLIVLNVKTQEEQKYTHEFLRLLVLANGGVQKLAMKRHQGVFLCMMILESFLHIKPRL